MSRRAQTDGHVPVVLMVTSSDAPTDIIGWLERSHGSERRAAFRAVFRADRPLTLLEPFSRLVRRLVDYQASGERLTGEWLRLPTGEDVIPVYLEGDDELVVRRSG